MSILQSLWRLKDRCIFEIKGVTVNDTFDRELTIGSVVGVMKIPDFTRRDGPTSARNVWSCTVIPR